MWWCTFWYISKFLFSLLFTVKKKSYYISSFSISDDIFRQMRMLDKLFKQMGGHDDIFLCSIFNINVISVLVDTLNSLLHRAIVQRVSGFLCSTREKQILLYLISSHFWCYFSTDKNTRQTFQADLMASPLNPHGHLSLDRSECWITIFKFMHCLRS